MTYKQLNESLIVSFLANASIEMIHRINDYQRKHGTEYRLKINDIIQNVIHRKEFRRSLCENYAGELKYVCLLEINKLKISELEKSKKFCTLNEDPKLCVIRLSEKINEIKLSTLKAQRDLHSIKIKDIKSNNLRHLPKNAYYDNEYKTYDEI